MSRSLYDRCDKKKNSQNFTFTRFVLSQMVAIFPFWNNPTAGKRGSLHFWQASYLDLITVPRGALGHAHFRQVEWHSRHVDYFLIRFFFIQFYKTDAFHLKNNTFHRFHSVLHNKLALDLVTMQRPVRRFADSTFHVIRACVLYPIVSHGHRSRT